jgi:LemA protein
VIIAGIVGVVIVLMGIGVYNSLVGKKNQVDNAFASIDVQLKKRHDLIPNLVASVKRYMGHEADVLTKVTQMRTQGGAGQSNEEQVGLENQITRALGGIMVAVENYPELKASDNFHQLQRTLNEVEEQLSAARRSFNASVTDFNDAVEMFPSNIVAGMMRYRRRELFEIPDAERANVDVGALFDA